MPLAPESTETQGCGLAGAELSSWPDGSCFVRLATAHQPFQARGYLLPESPAAILCGPAALSGTFAYLANLLASQGASALVVQTGPAVGSAESLACCTRFLRDRGARALALVAAGESAQAALGAACSLDAECVLLLAPAPLREVPRAGLLRGRPLFVCSRGEAAPEPLLALPHSSRMHFAFAGEGFDEVQGDLASVCVPFLTAALRPPVPGAARSP